MFNKKNKVVVLLVIMSIIIIGVYLLLLSNNEGFTTTEPLTTPAFSNIQQKLTSIGPCSRVDITANNMNIAGILILDQYGNNIFNNYYVTSGLNDIDGTVTTIPTGATSTPAFTGTTSTSAFTGTTSTPAFTGTTSTPAFTGTTSTPAFIDTTSTPAFTGATSTPAFTGATSTPAFTGATSTPAFTGATSTSPTTTNSSTVIVPPINTINTEIKPTSHIILNNNQDNLNGYMSDNFMLGANLYVSPMNNNLYGENDKQQYQTSSISSTFYPIVNI